MEFNPHIWETVKTYSVMLAFLKGVLIVPLTRKPKKYCFVGVSVSFLGGKEEK